MYRIRLLRHHGIEPYVVFDGGPLPAKKKTESSREKYVSYRRWFTIVLKLTRKDRVLKISLELELWRVKDAETTLGTLIPNASI